MIVEGLKAGHTAQHLGVKLEYACVAQQWESGALKNSFYINMCVDGWPYGVACLFFSFPFLLVWFSRGL